MSDLASGRYPDSEEEWLLDGQPVPPFRRSMSRRDVTSVFTSGSNATATLFVVAVPVQAGDIFGAVSFNVKTAATGTSTHSWVAIYNGVGTGAALVGAQSADVTTGFVVGANSLLLGALASNIGTVGTPQGPSTAANVAQGPAVWGVAFYNSSGTNGPVIDGMLSGSVAGEVAHTGQVSLINSCALAATATAPATLPTMTVGPGATATGIPYIVLSRS